MPLAMLAPYAAILGFLYLFLSRAVILNRMRAQAALGDKGDDGLLRAIRAHGNFAEYVPFMLILLGLLVAIQAPLWLIHGLAAIFTLGRLCHAYSISVHEPKTSSLSLRQAGMVLTLLTISIASFALLGLWVLSLLG